MMPRPGFAVAVALFAIVIIGAVAGGVAFAIGEETRVTAASSRAFQAESFAEQIAFDAVADWPCSACDQSPPGSVFIRELPRVPPLEGTLFVTRLDSALYEVTGEGRIETAAGALSSRQISLTVIARRDSTGVWRASRTSGEYWSAVYQM